MKGCFFILPVLLAVVQSSSFGATSGPYLERFDEVETWIYDTVICGTTTETKTRYADVNGSMWELAHYVPNDCWNDEYGFTDYYVHRNWPVNGEATWHRYGTYAGEPVVE